ncbi:DUF4179 domain-containing protein [Calidifontibacillus oryziterrae]|uniref:DUF4179 domain-containing protein n=1 Tax=Calidifontibacillus oryziterrae TaxID=1191699 RepID=UPI00031EE194|nr:DUF4179 domain-containing protein [Calidifontibacillus oryziterrae]
MKDIYELLNDVNIEESDFEEIEVTDLEKAKLKKSLKASIKKSKPKKVASWKKRAAAAVIIIGLSVTSFGLTFPTYAGNIPIIGDIFKFIDEERTGFYDNYKEYSTEMNMTEESNGIKITINDAIFDGETVSLTYSIESEHNLGDYPFVSGRLKIKGANGMTGSAKTTKVDDNHYVGIEKATDIDRMDSNSVKLKWDINSIVIPDQQKEISGKWSFSLSLKATDSKVQLADVSSEQSGVRVNINKISMTPVSFIIFYNQEVFESVTNNWDDVYVDLEIKDDLGNSYIGENNGGSGDGYNMSWSKTFEKLDENATKLIITPTVVLRLFGADNHGGGIINEDGEMIPIEPAREKGEQEEFKLNDFVIELEK